MEIPRHWRLKQQRYQLQGDVCPACETPHFPPEGPTARPCHECGVAMRSTQEGYPYALVGDGYFQMVQNRKNQQPIPVSLSVKQDA